MARHFKEEPESGRTTARRFNSESKTAEPQVQNLNDGAEPMQTPHAKDVRPEWEKPRGLGALLGALLGILSVALIIAAVGTVMLNRSISLDSADKDVRQGLTKEKDAAAESQNDGFYVLIVGTDSRDDDYTGRSDVLILARVDPTNATVTLVSIPRDTMVHIVGDQEPEKINAAYAYYGANAATVAVSEFAGVPISHFVKVNFTGLEHVVDLLGGVRVNVPETVQAGNGGMYIEAGEQVLDGATALAYARERYTVSGGDFGRAQAQRLIITAIIKQILAAPASELPSLITNLAACVSTDYNVPDLVSLALKFQGKDPTIYSAVCPSYGYWEGDVSYVGTMFKEWQDMMKRVDAGLDPNDETVEIPEPQASNDKLGAATNSAAPRDYEGLLDGTMTTDDVAPAE